MSGSRLAKATFIARVAIPDLPALVSKRSLSTLQIASHGGGRFSKSRVFGGISATVLQIKKHYHKC
jgi:hypothetical protein